MIRVLFKLLILVVILAGVAAFLLGYRLGGNDVETPVSARQIAPGIDTEKARQTGAAIGQTVATGAARAEQALDEAALTAKIKSKMALDAIFADGGGYPRPAIRYAGSILPKIHAAVAAGSASAKPRK